MEPKDVIAQRICYRKYNTENEGVRICHILISNQFLTDTVYCIFYYDEKIEE